MERSVRGVVSDAQCNVRGGGFRRPVQCVRRHAHNSEVALRGDPLRRARGHDGPACKGWPAWPLGCLVGPRWGDTTTALVELVRAPLVSESWCHLCAEWRVWGELDWGRVSLKGWPVLDKVADLTRQVREVEGNWLHGKDGRPLRFRCHLTGSLMSVSRGRGVGDTHETAMGRPCKPPIRGVGQSAGCARWTWRTALHFRSSKGFPHHQRPSLDFCG